MLYRGTVMGRANKRPLVTSILVATLGLPLLWLGGQLMFSGGTPYYLVSGLLMLARHTTYFRVDQRALPDESDRYWPIRV